MCGVRHWHLYRLHRAVYQEEEKAWSRTRNAVLTAFSRRYAMELAVNKVALTPIGSLEPVHFLCIAEPFACLILEGVTHATSREYGR